MNANVWTKCLDMKIKARLDSIQQAYSRKPIIPGYNLSTNHRSSCSLGTAQNVIMLILILLLATTIGYLIWSIFLRKSKEKFN